MKLRPYQEEAVKAFFHDYEQEPVGAGILYLATGAGKTVIATEIAKRLGGNTLFLVHRDELAKQTISKFLTCWPGVDIGLVKAQSNMLGRQITVASIQTVSGKKRLEQLLEYKYDLVICDEVHHAASKTWKTVLNGLNCYKLGLTATPQRTDKARLDDIFKKILYRYTIIDGIEQGYLCDIEGKMIDMGIDFSGVKVTAGDFNTKALGEIMSNHEIVKFTCEKWAELASDRKTVFFGVDIEHCKRLAAELRRMGYKADWIAGSMSDAERHQTLQDFSRDKTQVLASCMLLTEGWDEPSVDCISMTRPTSSESLYIQMVGRGLRLFPDKENCKLLDFVGASGKHRIMQLGILAGNELEQKESEGERKKPSSDKIRPGDIKSIKLLIAKEKDIEIQTQKAHEIRRYDWIHTEDGLWVMGLGSHHLGYLVITQETDGWVIEHWSTLGWEDVTNRLNEPTTLDWCISMAEAEAERLADSNIKYSSRDEQDWHDRPPSPKQADLIRRNGIPVPTTAKEASVVLNKLFFGWFQKKRQQAKQSAILEMRKMYYMGRLPYPMTLDRINKISYGEYQRIKAAIEKSAVKQRSFYA